MSLARLGQPIWVIVEKSFQLYHAYIKYYAVKESTMKKIIVLAAILFSVNYASATEFSFLNYSNTSYNHDKEDYNDSHKEAKHEEHKQEEHKNNKKSSSAHGSEHSEKNVSAVPVPASLPLMATALGMFGIARRRNAIK
jgi:hypothetical protein